MLPLLAKPEEGGYNNIYARLTWIYSLWDDHTAARTSACKRPGELIGTNQVAGHKTQSPLCPSPKWSSPGEYPMIMQLDPCILTEGPIEPPANEARPTHFAVRNPKTTIHVVSADITRWRPGNIIL
jgi:hypothetical protein